MRLADIARRTLATLTATVTVAAGLAAGVMPATATTNPYPDTMYFTTGFRNMNLVGTGGSPHVSYGFTASSDGSVMLDWDDNVAYCLDADLDAPGDYGATWVDGNSSREQVNATPTYVRYALTADSPLTGAVGWIAANGYPTVSRVYDYDMDTGDARAITQIALWLQAGDVVARDGVLYFASTGAVYGDSTHLSSVAFYPHGTVHDSSNPDTMTMLELAQRLAADGEANKTQTTYRAWAYTATSGTYQRMLYVTSSRDIALAKHSADTAYTDGNDAYSMEGAEYTVYADDALDMPVGTLVTDAAGMSTTTLTLPPGDYYVKETKAPASGYLLNDSVMTIGVTAGAGIQTFDLDGDQAEHALADTGTIRVQKALASQSAAGETHAGITSLAGVRFRLDWYPTVAATAADLAGLTPAASAVWETDADGVVDYAAADPVEGSWPFTDESGNRVLPLGTVEVTETDAPDWAVVAGSGNQGSLFTLTDAGDHVTVVKTTLDAWHDDATVTGDPATTVVFPDDEARGSVRVVKTDDDTKTSTPQGDATLDGVEYEIVNDNARHATVNGVDYEPGAVVATIVTGLVDGEYVAATEARALPYGSYLIRESSSSTGYHLAGFEESFTIARDGQEVMFTVTQHGVTVTGGTVAGYGANTNDVQRGGIQLVKTDRETGLPVALGAATLDGTVFEIVNRSAGSVVVNGVDYEPGDIVTTIAAAWQSLLDEDGQDTGQTGYVARTAIDELPYGTYEVREAAASDGYLRDADSRAWSRTFTVGHDGGDATTGTYPANAAPNRYATLADTDAGTLPANQVQRVDFHFAKKDGETMDPMGNIAWLLTSNTTGETHVLVTDTNGEIHTKSCEAVFNDNGTSTTGCRVRTDNTNANDPDAINTNGAVAIVDGEYVVVDADRLDPTAGTWFTGIGPDTANATVQWTSATTYDVTDANGTVHAAAVDNLLRALPYDDYTLTELATPGANDGRRMVVTTLVAREYTKNADGTVNHDANGIDLDYGTIDNDRLGIATRLAYYGNGADPFDDDGNPGDKTAPATGTVKLVDVVDYYGIPAGQYTLSGELHIIDNGTPDPNPVATAATTITVKSTNSAQAKLSLVIDDATALAGHTVVCYETLTDANGTIVAQHHDPDDTDQQVAFPAIATTATGDIDDEANATASSIAIVDTVEYANLQAGKTYTLTGTLHQRADDNTDQGPVTDIDGNEVTTTVTFVPAATDGTIDIGFQFTPDPDLAGHTVVAYETLTKNNTVYAIHANIADDNQDIHFPDIHTVATDLFDDDKQMGAGTTTLNDTVSYANLVPGHEYTITATLHIRADNGDDNGPVTDTDGNPITIQTTFTPDQENGTITIEIPFDSTPYAGTTIVAYETLTRNNTVLAIHANIADDNQAVTIANIHTTLTGTRNTHDIQPDTTGTDHATITLIDTVEYHHLAPNTTYRLDGTLHVRDATGHDQGTLTDTDGNAITASTTFVPNTTDGTQEVTFQFTMPANTLADTVLVAYETLTSNPDTTTQQTVATHADITDNNQTVTITTTPTEQPADQEPATTTPTTTTTTTQTSQTLANTGNNITTILATMAILTAIAAALASQRATHRKKPAHSRQSVSSAP
ncbi:VaFE repeat-containing surface-anchored protein [Bifidobacterium choloepi]|nr:VaFE repeat-containing surface-anchored protein [Bifidobacterium choloepi]